MSSLRQSILLKSNRRNIKCIAGVAVLLEAFDPEWLDDCGDLSSCDGFGHAFAGDGAEQEAVGAVSGC
jgi:hypothetical protein